MLSNIVIIVYKVVPSNQETLNQKFTNLLYTWDMKINKMNKGWYKCHFWLNYRIHIRHKSNWDIFVPRHWEVNKHIFVPNGGYRVLYSSNTICIVCRFENWEISLITWIFHSFSWSIFSLVTCLDQSCACKTIWWITICDIMFLKRHLWHTYLMGDVPVVGWTPCRPVRYPISWEMFSSSGGNTEIWQNPANKLPVTIIGRGRKRHN